MKIAVCDDSREDGGDLRELLETRTGIIMQHFWGEQRGDSHSTYAQKAGGRPW